MQIPVPPQQVGKNIKILHPDCFPLTSNVRSLVSGPITDRLDVFVSLGLSCRRSCSADTCVTHSLRTPFSFWAWAPCSPEATGFTTWQQTQSIVVRSAQEEKPSNELFIVDHPPTHPALSLAASRVPYAPDDHHEHNPSDLCMFTLWENKQTCCCGARRDL